MASREQTINSTGQLAFADQPTAGLTDHLDKTILRLCNTVLTDCVHNDLSCADANTKFCHQLRQASTADTVYLCDRYTLSIVATSSTNSDTKRCTDTEAMHQSLTTAVVDLCNCDTPRHLPKIPAQPASGKYSYTVLPLNDGALLAVIVDAELEENTIGNYYTRAVSALHGFYQTQQNRVNPQPEQSRMDCEAQVLDALQQSFRHLSYELTQHRLKILKQQIGDITITFNSCTVYNRTTEKLITGLRAIPVSQSILNKIPTAETQDSHNTPDHLSIAKNWNADMISIVDTHVLKHAIYQYKALCEKQNITRVEEVQPLVITHHPQSLSNTSYIETLRRLLEKSVIHGSRLILEAATTCGEYNVHGTGSNAPLQKLCNDFGVQILRSGQPTRPLETRGTSEFSIADEFNVPGINSSHHHSGRRSHNAKVKRA